MTNYIFLIQQWIGGRFATKRDDRGAITTETAVVTFLLVSMAITIVGLIYAYATGVVEGFDLPEVFN
ncbi:MAG TPA: hypothetical protein VGJ86_22030 [Acidimicrobiales bacterium]|jgi:hypothetical protein